MTDTKQEGLPSVMENPEPIGLGDPECVLSVLLPNYNHARYIPRALRALLDQSRPPEEIIVIDDASTDDSIEAIDVFAAKFSCIRVLRNPTNRGAIAALTRGLQAARGRYVYFAAADDWVMPGFFARAVEALEVDTTVGLFCGEAVLVDGQTGRLIGYRPPVRPIYRAGTVSAERAERLLRRSDNWILTGSAVFRRSAVLAVGALDERLGTFADGYLARKVALTSGFIFMPEVAATWCVFPEGISRQTAQRIESVQRLLEVASACLAIDPIFPRWYAQLFQRRFRFAVCRLALLADPVNRPLLKTVGAGSWIDRLVLEALSRLTVGPFARNMAAGWLWLRLRPYALWDLVRTAAARRAERLIDSARTSKR
jgi:glycosyltransferase involved in cell wall biosynthesis